MEKILSIKDSEFKNGDYSTYVGYIITTDSQEIKLGISEGQSCCENYGYFIANDEEQDFVGSFLISVSITDTALNQKSLDAEEDIYEGGIIFVNIETTKGLLQFVAYNSHNGYYGHEALVISQQLNHSTIL